MAFLDFALYHAWLIPLLPAVAFLLIVFLFSGMNKTSATVAISCMAASFILSLGVGGAVIARHITVEQPVVYKAVWFSMPGFTTHMGVLIDPTSAMMLFVVTLVSLLVQIYSIGYMHGDAGFTRFFAYLSLFAAAMLGLVISVNFLQMFVFWELVGLCSYLLIGYYYYKISAREAAKKAFMTTRVGDFGMLLGVLLIQILFGTMDFGELPAKLKPFINDHGTGLLTLVALLIFIGPIGKSGQFPLHVWLPDAMEGPTPVSALIHAATMVVAGVYLVARSYFLFADLPMALSVVAWVGGFTAFFAAFIAITQREIKRILAYSTVSQLGFMMLALGVGSLTASMFHLMTHAFFKALMFLAAGSVLHALHDKADIFAMGGLKKAMPVTFAAMGIGVLAIAGIPPFAGFFSKDEILAAAAHASTPLYLLASLTAFMTAFYMSRMFIVVFFGKPDPHDHPHESGPSMLIALVVLGFFSVVGGIVPYGLHFGDWVRFGPAHHAGIDWFIALTSTGLSLAAMFLAWQIYGAKRYSADQLAARWPLLFTLSFRKFYIDEIYLWFNKTVIDGLGKVLYWVDINIVDGLVNSLSRGTARLGGALRLYHTGQMQHYALVFFGAAVLAIVIMAAFGPSHLTFAHWGGGR